MAEAMELWGALAGMLLVVVLLVSLVLLLLAARAARRWLKQQGYDAEVAAAARFTLWAVTAAEQLYRNGTLLSIDRFEWVQAQVHAKWPNLTEQEIEVFIESSVVQLKGALVWLDADV